VFTIAGGDVTEAAPRLAVDEATFDRRFAEVRARLLRICEGLVGQDHAEDVVQDVYLRARSRRRQLRDDDLFEAWICRATINECYNRHRQQARLRDRLPRFARTQPPPTPDLGLRELIEALPTRERTIVVLHYGYGYALDEVARLLDLTSVNTRTILFRARRKLGEQLRGRTMTDSHATRLYRRLLDGATLTRDDERHLRTCVACQRAVADAERFDGRLQEAAASLAREPIPAEAASAASMRPGWTDRFALAPVGLGAAALVVVAAIGFAVSGRLPVADQQSPSPGASASARPTPAQTVVPSPSAPPAEAAATDPYLVGPQSICADGDAGFSFFLPEGWYADRRVDDARGCRTAAPLEPGQTGQPLEPAVTFMVVPEAPTFEGVEIDSREQIELANGIVLDRVAVFQPETGALAAEHRLTYVTPLLAPDAGGPGGYLVASTDPNHLAWVDGLDRMMERLDVYPSLKSSADAVAQAEALFHDRDVCLDDERGLGVVFPDAWWTNTAVDGAPACSYFAPGFFEITEPATVPDSVEISLSLVEGAYGTHTEVIGLETLTVLDRPATRWELATTDGRVYEYVIQLGETAEFGPNLVARTHGGTGDDIELARAVLDEMMERIGDASPPPGATSDNPPIEGDRVTATDAGGDFRLDFMVEQDRYRAGQPILADAVLTYLGDEPSVQVRGSGTGIVGFRLHQLDGLMDPGGASTTDCVRYEVSSEQPMWVEFGKSGSFDGDDPNIAFYEAYFEDHLLRLPPGRWEMVAWAGGSIGDDCGDGDPLSLEARIEIAVEP
jgi:DNA-directed RNA polymerase specialized sigma24 family protein